MNSNKIFKRIARKWYIIAIVVMLAVAGGLIGNELLVKDTYVASGSCYVDSIYDEETGADMTVGVLNNFINLSKTNAVLEAVAKDPSLQVLGYKVEELNKKLKVYRDNNLIFIECTSYDSIHSQIIVKAYINSGFPKVKTFLGTNKDMFSYTAVAMPEEGKREEGGIIQVLLISLIIGLMLALTIIITPLLMGKIAYEAGEIAELFETKLLSVVPSFAMDTGKNDNPNIEYGVGIAELATAMRTENANLMCLTGIDIDCGASELAGSLTELMGGYTDIMLVETNFRSPKFDKLFETSGNGLSEYLLGEATLDEICRTVHGNMKIITAGQRCAQAIEKLLSGAFVSKWREICGRADTIIVDTAPLGNYRDALSIGSMVGSIALVIEGTSSQRLVKSIINDIDVSKINLLGIVLNKYHRG